MSPARPRDCLLYTSFKVQPFIATLGTQLAARGFALLINKELSISLGTNAPQLKYVGNGNVFGLIPFPTFAFIILILVLTVILRKKDFGRGVYAVAVSYTHLDVYKRQGGALLKTRRKLHIIDKTITKITQNLGNIE